MEVKYINFVKEYQEQGGEGRWTSTHCILERIWAYYGGHSAQRGRISMSP